MWRNTSRKMLGKCVSEYAWELSLGNTSRKRICLKNTAGNKSWENKPKKIMEKDLKENDEKPSKKMLRNTFWKMLEKYV